MYVSKETVVLRRCKSITGLYLLIFRQSDIAIRRREVKISLDLSREFAYDAGKVKEFKTKVRAPKGSGKGKKSFFLILMVL